MLEYQQRATDALTDAPARLVAIVSSSTPAGLVEQSVVLCGRFDCESTGLSVAIEIAKEYAVDSVPEVAPTDGVGTQLAKQIPEWAVQFKGGCGCKDMQKKMDRWGPDGCYARRNQIVAHLMAQSDHLIPAFRLVPDAVKRVIAGRMLNKAIRAAKA
ncbi:MAG: hypothetical protein ACR2NI_03070 [Pirellulales bacterium]